jgi:hypothetical protein
MTVIRPNSISGINSITAQVSALNFYDSAGAALPVTAGAINVDNINATGVSTFANATIAGGSITGVSTIGVTTVTATNLTVNGNAYPTAGPLSNRNLIINGAMQVAQRGTSSTTSGYSSVDRTRVAQSETNTQSQLSLTSTDTPYSLGFRNAFRLQNTTVSDASASTYREIDYRIEALDIANSGWDYTSTNSFITFSFWLRASVTQSYYLYIRTVDGTERLLVKELAVTADTWEKFEITIPGDSGITVNNDNGIGLILRFIPWYGTTYTGSGTLDVWSSSTTERVPDMTNTWVTTLNSTFDLTGLQLEVGSVATPFEHRSFGDELARCQRYYQKSYNYSYAPGTTTSENMTMVYGVTNGSNDIAWNQVATVSMRTNATVTYYSQTGTVGSWGYSRSGASGSATVTLYRNGENGWNNFIDLGVSWVPAAVEGHWVASAEL